VLAAIMIGGARHLKQRGMMHPAERDLPRHGAATAMVNGSVRPANAFETNPLHPEPPRRHSLMVQNAAFAFGTNPTGGRRIQASHASASDAADYLEPDSKQPAVYAAAKSKADAGAGYDLGIIGSAAEYATIETSADAAFDAGTIGAAVKKEYDEYANAESSVDVDVDVDAAFNSTRNGVDAEYEAMENIVRVATHASSIAAANLQPAPRRAASNRPTPKPTNEESKKPQKLFVASPNGSHRKPSVYNGFAEEVDC
jgi:hypothetical protein